VPADLDALLTRLPGCARLGPDALAVLAGAARAEQWPAGTQLIAEGQPAPDWYCIVESGAIQLSRVDLEGAGILDYLAAGEVFDPGAPGLPAPCSASAVEATRGLLVPQSLVIRHRGALALGPTTADRGEIALFVRRVADLVKGPPVTCAAGATVAEAAQLMTRRSVGSVIVVAEDGATAGIVTDRDLRTRVVAPGLPSSTPVGRVMSSPVIGIGPEAPAFDALLEMMRRGVRHLAVTAAGRLLGVVSSYDVVLLQGAHPVGLAREIEAQVSEEGLVAVAPRVASVVKWLATGGAGAAEIGRLVAELNDRLVRRALSLVMSSLEASGRGRPPVPFAWLAAGSEGRREQTLKTDQDNGLVYRDPPVDLEAAAAAYFERLAAAMSESLIRLGFPLCDGGFMASNSRWRQPERVWREYFRSWMETPQPEPVLRASLFFDLRPIGGDEDVGRALWEWVCEHAPARTLFLRYMAKAALERQVPLGFFGGFVVERTGAHKDRLDLKARGVFPMTQSMRVYALSLGVQETNTLDRLKAAGERGTFTASEVGELGEAYELISRLRLTHQLACLDAGIAPDNFINPRTLGKADRLLLKEAFKSIAWLQRGLEDHFQTAQVV
jgi:CBS domain-containing protein